RWRLAAAATVLAAAAAARDARTGNSAPFSTGEHTNRAQHRVGVRSGRSPDRPLDSLLSVHLICAVLHGPGDATGRTMFTRRGPREPLAGTTVQTTPGTPGHLWAWFPQFTCMDRPGELGVFLAVFRLTSEKPVVRTHLRPPSSCS